MTLRFLQLSDLDLGARPAYLGDGVDARAREILDSFRDAVTLALDDAGIDGVLIPGNLFDRHRPLPEVWAFARGLFGRLVAAGKVCVVLPGSRDSAVYKDAVFRTERLPGVTVLAGNAMVVEREIRGQRVHFHGATCHPGAPRAFEGFTRTQSDGWHIGLVNGAVPEHPEWDVRPRDLIVEPGVLSESGFHYVAMGGYHEFTPMHLIGTVAAYSGTLEGTHFVPGDLGEKAALVVEIDQDGVRFARHPMGRKILEDVTLDLEAESITDADGLLAALIARGRSNVMARITLRGPLEFLVDLRRITEQASPRFAWLELRDHTDLLGSALLRHLENETTIRGFFVRRMLRRIAELSERARTAPMGAKAPRDLAIARRALKIGLEQFLDEERAASLENPREESEPSRIRAVSKPDAPRTPEEAMARGDRAREEGAA